MGLVFWPLGVFFHSFSNGLDAFISLGFTPLNGMHDEAERLRSLGSLCCHDQPRHIGCELGPVGRHAIERGKFLADVIGTLQVQLADAPTADVEWNQREDVQRVRREAIREALRPGVQGWVDDSVSIFGDDWGIDLGRVTCRARFWHSDDDKNGPLTAIQRLVDAIPGASLIVWSGEGHSAPARNMEHILRDLIVTSGGGQ